MIDYRISMEFSSPLYASITRQFFDYLVVNVNQQFEERCSQVGQTYNSEIAYQSDQFEHAKKTLSIESSDPDVDLWNFQDKKQTTTEKKHTRWELKIKNSLMSLQNEGYLTSEELRKLLEQNLSEVRIVFETFAHDNDLKNVYCRHLK